MHAKGAESLRTFAPGDHLGFRINKALQVRKVIKFLELDRADVAKLSNVSYKVTRYNGKVPREIQEGIAELATMCEEVAGHFNGHQLRTALWFRTKNSMLGEITPRDMIRFGRLKKLKQLIAEAINEDANVLA